MATGGGRPGWDRESRAKTEAILANALAILGEQSGQSQPLEEAIRYYKEALKGFDRERTPLDERLPFNFDYYVR